MGRSQDSFNKREREKKRLKKKKEKLEKKEQKKLDNTKTEEFMYVDKDGNLTSTPPDPAEKLEISIEDIEISIPKKEKSEKTDFRREGRVKFFNNDKGYGFIMDTATSDSFFVHIDELEEPVNTNDAVSFDIGKGPKGPIAIAVRLIK